MEELKCSICGYVSNQKKFKYKDINSHFENAVEIWCPTNKCKEENKGKRILPKNCQLYWWIDYGGWYTIEVKPKIQNIEEIRSIWKVKMIKEIGETILKVQGKEV